MGARTCILLTKRANLGPMSHESTRAERYSHADLIDVASRYYLQDETMEAIGARLRISRSTVSRMLAQARAEQIVRITVSDEAVTRPGLVADIDAIFGVRAHLVPVRPGVTSRDRLDAVARVAAHHLADAVTDDSVLGVAWGTTLDAVVRRLPKCQRSGVRVVQLNGAASISSSGIAHTEAVIGGVASAFNASVRYFPVPAFFDRASTKEALWTERSVASVVELQRSCTVAVFGVGAPVGEVPSQVWISDHLDQADRTQLAADDVVGDVCTVLLRADGTWADLPINQRASGPSPDDLRRIDRRLCIAAGPSKARALLAALRAGVMTDLVVDDLTARKVCALAASKSRGSPTG